MLGSKINHQNSNTNNQHRRQLSESVMWSERSSKIYKDEDRQLIQHLVNEYLLEGSNEILDLIRNSSIECFEALVDFLWQTISQTIENNEDDLSIYNQRSSLLSSSSTNVYRRVARRRLAIIIIETLKLLGTQTSHSGRFDLQRQQRLFGCPSSVRQLINFEPDIHGLSCLSLASVILINPALIHGQLQIMFDALKYAANHFAKTDLSFETPTTFAVSIYSLFYLLYILYPNNLRRELQNDAQRGINNNEKSQNRYGIEKVLLPLFSHFKLHPGIVCSSVENEKHEHRWQNESWQQIIANGDRYIVFDDTSPLSNDFRKRKDEESKYSVDSTQFEIGKILEMCNEYAENVLHLSETKSQIDEDSIEIVQRKTFSTDNYSNYSDSFCQTYEQQWHTTIQNGQRNLARIQAPVDFNRRQNNSNGQKKDSNASNQVATDHHVHTKVHLQLDMLDCNYEQDKREFYAQLIRDSKKNFPMSEIDRNLREKENLYEKLSIEREEKCSPIHDVRNRTDEFHHLNEAFYNSLSATRIELKTDEDDRWQKKNSFEEKQNKLKIELEDLKEAKNNFEIEIVKIQRRLFETKQNGKESKEIDEILKKLSVELICTRKKHQIVHAALVQLKLKKISTEKLILIHDKPTENDFQLDEKKRRFDEIKQFLEKQKSILAAKRTNFGKTRSMNTHKINVIRREIDSIRVCQSQTIKKFSVC